MVYNYILFASEVDMRKLKSYTYLTYFEKVCKFATTFDKWEITWFLCWYTARIVVSSYKLIDFLSFLAIVLIDPYTTFLSTPLLIPNCSNKRFGFKLAVCRAHLGLPVGFLLLWYSILFTVESLSYGLSCKPNIYVSWSTSELRVRLAPCNSLSPPVKYFTDRFKAILLLWIFYVFFCLVFVMPLCASVYLCLVVTCWERADLLAFVCGV